MMNEVNCLVEENWSKILKNRCRGRIGLPDEKAQWITGQRQEVDYLTGPALFQASCISCIHIAKGINFMILCSSLCSISH
jgi:hypothetical protein